MEDVTQDHPDFMCKEDVKIRLFAGLLYDEKTFLALRIIYLGHTANKIINFHLAKPAVSSKK